MKAFIYLKSLKVICEEVLRKEVVKCQSASLQKKIFHISSFMYFAFIFYERITDSSEEALKVCEQDFFQKM